MILSFRVLQRVELLEQLHIHDNHDEEEDDEVENPLDGCLHVFIDLGSNRGVQIRKLYETHVFPLAPVLPLYQRFFGQHQERDLQEICSVRVGLKMEKGQDKLGQVRIGLDMSGQVIREEFR